jgi:hypothetical protein
MTRRVVTLNDQNQEKELTHMSSTKQAELTTTIPGVGLQVGSDFTTGGAAQPVTDPQGTASALQLSKTVAIIPSGSQLGIGTVPGSPLHVGANNSVRFELGSSAQFSMGGNGNMNVDAPNVPAGRFTVQNGGNVGINQASPQYKLDVNGTFRSTGGIVVQGMQGESQAPSSANLQLLFIDTNTGIIYYHD